MAWECERPGVRGASGVARGDVRALACTGPPGTRPGQRGRVHGRGAAGARAPRAAQYLPAHPAARPALVARAGYADPPPRRRTARPREPGPGRYRLSRGGGWGAAGAWVGL